MLKKITNRVYYMDYNTEKKYSVMGLIIGDNASLLVDAGSSMEQSKEFLQLIKKLDMPPIKYLALTHSHESHIRGIENFDLTNIVNGMTSEKLKRYSKDNINIFSHIIYDEFLKIDLGGIVVELERIPSDHTRDCSIVNVPSEKIVFLGDALYSNKKNIKPRFTRDLMIPLLKELQCYEASYYIPSHSEVYTNETFMDYSNVLINIGKILKFDTEFSVIKEKIAPINNIFDEKTLDLYIEGFILGSVEK